MRYHRALAATSDRARGALEKLAHSCLCIFWKPFLIFFTRSTECFGALNEILDLTDFFTDLILKDEKSLKAYLRGSEIVFFAFLFIGDRLDSSKLFAFLKYFSF